MSASGGVGKSSVAVLAALRARHKGLSAAIVDADLQFGDAARLLGLRDAMPLDEALARREAFVADEGADLPFVISPSELVEEAELVARQLPSLVRRLSESFDVVVLNSGAFWSDVHAALLECADRVAFLMDQRPSSLAATVKAVDLCARLGAATSGFVFLMNRYDEKGMVSVMDASCALHGAEVRPIRNGGRDVEELLGSGAALDLTRERNAFCDSVAEFVDPLLPAQERSASGRQRRERKRGFSFFHRKEEAL